MELHIENHKLLAVANFLFGITLKGQTSRHKTRILNLIKKRLEELNEEETALLKEHSHLNEDGSFKFVEGTKNLQIKDPAEYFKEQQLLAKEVFVIGSPDIQESLAIMKDVLSDYDEEVGADDAEAFDHLCIQFGI